MKRRAKKHMKIVRLALTGAQQKQLLAETGKQSEWIELSVVVGRVPTRLYEQVADGALMCW